MDTNEIQERVNAIRATMTAKGLAKAEVLFWFQSDAEPYVTCRWHDAAAAVNSYEMTHKSFRAATIESMLSAAEDFVRSIPDAEERKLTEFMGALGKVIDLGKDRGIDVDFLNPLTATMKRLSENIITDQRAA